jgi:hypothetical protein
MFMAPSGLSMRPKLTWLLRRTNHHRAQTRKNQSGFGQRRFAIAMEFTSQQEILRKQTDWPWTLAG